ncbi:MAG: DMT family transporter [Oscillospiraceae bacterium]|jgi:drug/metabolite transporter (DMT)-like permease|nr:DMT family transporter [Oscillospiraceae bacterium]MDD3260664.1 DMT family transporter [Oscillospiraceae bacterium]
MQKKSTSQKNALAALPAALVCTALWGSAFPFIKIGYRVCAVTGAFSQTLFAGCRFALAGILVLLFQAVRQRHFSLPPRGSRLAIFRLGLVMTAAQYLCFYLGLAHTTGVRGSIIQGTGTFLTVLLAHFLLRGSDRLTAGRVLGCLVGFAGVVLVNLDGSGGAFSFQGEGLLFLAAAMFSVGSILSKFLTGKADPFCITGWQLLIGGVVLAVAGFLGGGRITLASGTAWGVFLYLAALSSVAFTIWTILLQKYPAGQVAVYTFLTPVFGVLLSALLLHESIAGAKTAAALVFVCVGILLVNLTAPHSEKSKTS